MNKLAIPLLLSASALLSGCPERLVGPHANDFYVQGTNMLCVNHSKDVQKGVVWIMNMYGNADDDIERIPLNRINPKKSCAVFNINDHITTTTTDNDEIELTPNRQYNLSTGLLIENLKEGKGSGFGPKICFSQEGANPVVLEVENHSDRRNREHLLCQINEDIESTL